MWLRLAALIGAALPLNAGALEIWLARPADCKDCAIYERAAQRRGYGFALEYRERNLTIPILSTGKNVLASDIVSQLSEDVGPSSAAWDSALTVLVVDVDRVLFAANIAESADTSQWRQSEGAMFPPEMPPERDPSLRRTNIEAELGASEWNLEYFVDVALGRTARRFVRRPVDLLAAERAALGPRNVVLWASAAKPLENSAAVAGQLTGVRDALDTLRLDGIRYSLLYGHGPGVDGNDTSYVVDGRTSFKRAEIDASHAADAAALNAVLTAVRYSPRSRTLLVQAGQGSATGAPLWGSATKLTPADLAPLADAGSGELVVVSNACYGGQFARSAQCGFFAAHPDALAASCDLAPAALEESDDDYLSLFFRAATGAMGGAQSAATSRRRPAAAPATLPTLADAHWQAALELDDHALPYTTTDALVDEYFAGHPLALQETITVAELRAAAPQLSRAESDAIEALTAGLAPEVEIALEGHVELHHDALAARRDAANGESTAIGARNAPPYRLALVLLARRVAYAAQDVANTAFADAAQCEQRSLVDLLGSSVRR